MKELSTEEKAKAYDEVVERAKIEKEKSRNLGLLEFIDENFLELKESGDEKIINLLKMVVEKWHNVGYADYVMDIPKSDILSWLEKQGEHANFRSKIQIGDKVTRNEDGVLVNLSQLNRVAKKQGEQKTADKVESKFKIGDWVVYDHRAYQVVELPKEGYINLGLKRYEKTEYAPSTYCTHWTIQDAKDGDVLASNRSIFIFSQEYMAGKPEAHCGIMNGLFLVKPEGCWTNEKCYPSTKEQRDLLFKKMHEAGYEWDAEKKELKKIESKTAAWTPMDEQRVENLLAIIEGHGYPEEVAWLNSLGDRVQPQYITITDEELAQAKKDAYNDVLDKIEYNNENPTFDDGWSAAIWYLKKRTAQPQTTWKPSDEQMEALEYYLRNVIDKEGVFGRKIVELYEDLWNLREE